MSTGYRGGTTTPDLDLLALEQRVARLEAQRAERNHQQAVRRMWPAYYAYSASMAIAIVVYLAGSLD